MRHSTGPATARRAAKMSALGSRAAALDIRASLELPLPRSAGSSRASISDPNTTRDARVVGWASRVPDREVWLVRRGEEAGHRSRDDERPLRANEGVQR